MRAVLKFIAMFNFLLLTGGLAFGQQVNPNKLPPCPILDSDDYSKWTKCYGRFENNGNVYHGEYRNGNPDGFGIYYYFDGSVYKGSWKDGNWDGVGVHVMPSGKTFPGTYSKNARVKEHPVNFDVPTKKKDLVGIDESKEFGQGLQENRGRVQELNEVPKKREQARTSQPIKLQVSNTTPASDGSYTIRIQTNADTASLKLNGEEQGGRPDGVYVINRLARAGQETKLDIVARDVYGNTDSKSITVSRVIIESRPTYAPLNPTKIKRQAERDAVAIIIGVSDYRNLPKAVHADDDARAFYDYAIRALGVKPENIKLLVNQDADEIEIYKAFKTWLPSKVRKTTDVFVFYSGHGYTTADGKGLYWFPHRADRDLISKTAILVEELNNDILATSPRSVTVFADACYSGQARSGETLIASARPIVPKAETRLFPESFAVITASQHDQISSSSPDLQHGIFSYYLMKGMEGEADSNRDGKITLGEMQAYLVETVTRQAAAMSRKQEPQVLGDSSRVLVGK